MTISEAKLNWPTANRCRTKPHLLVIDDDVAVADTLVMVLNSEGFEARAVYRAEEGVELARSLEFDFLVTAVVMTQMNGIDAAIQIRKLLPKCKIQGTMTPALYCKARSLRVTDSKFSPSLCILSCSSRRFAQSSPDSGAHMVERGLRRNSSNDSTVVQEECESPTCEIIRRPVQVPAVTPRQTNLAFTSVQLTGMNPPQRGQALSCLANLLNPDGVYDPCRANDRLLLGMKGSISEFELSVLRSRMLEAALARAYRGHAPKQTVYRSNRMDLTGPARCMPFGGSHVDAAIARELVRAVQPMSWCHVKRWCAKFVCGFSSRRDTHGC